MKGQESLLAQLDTALRNKDLSRRAEILRRVTDLFVLSSEALTADQTDLFDEVMSRLIENIDVGVRAELSARIAEESNAPSRVVHTLALDDAIDVAGPVLHHSERLSEIALVEAARTKSQRHLLALSGRKSLSEAVTDVLVERGDREVATNTARNHGARFSTRGFSTLTVRSREDGDLVSSLWTRSDVPRHMLVRIFAEASEITRRRLEAEYPRKAAVIRNAVAIATSEFQARARAASDERGREHGAVASLHAKGLLDEAHLFAFASGGMFDKTVSALSLMCDLPVGLIERCLVQKRTEQILVLAKAIDLSSQTTAALVLMQAGKEGIPRSQLDQYLATFSRLQKKSAQTALQFYRMREIAKTSEAR